MFGLIAPSYTTLGPNILAFSLLPVNRFPKKVASNVPIAC